MTTEKSINQEKQQKINRTLVLRLVRQESLRRGRKLRNFPDCREQRSQI